MSRLSSPLRLIKIGFWFGTGLLIPIVCGFLATVGIELWVFNTTLKEKVAAAVRSATSGATQTDYIRVTTFKESDEEDFVVVRGTAENTGTEAVSSFSINVEFFDDKKIFLSECTETVTARVRSKESENFEIRCRLNPQVPARSFSTVRVVSTSNF